MSEKNNSSVENINETVDGLKKKIASINDDIVIEMEDKEVNNEAVEESVVDEKVKMHEFKEKATKIIDEAKDQIRQAKDKIKNDEELNRRIDEIKDFTNKSFESLKGQYNEFVNDPKVRQSYVELKDFIVENIEKLEDFTDVQVHKLRENEGVNRLIDDVTNTVNAASDKINEFTSRPEVAQKIENAKDVAINLAEKSTQALKDWLRPENKENEK